MRARADSSTLDVFSRSLADSRRRSVLSHLLDGSDGSATIGRLVDGIVEAETQSSSPDRESVAVTLDHDHQPLLAERGLIERERARGVVTTTRRNEQIRSYLSVVQNVTEPDVVA